MLLSRAQCEKSAFFRFDFRLICIFSFLAQKFVFAKFAKYLLPQDAAIVDGDGGLKLIELKFAGFPNFEASKEKLRRLSILLLATNTPPIL